jgi:RNA polymerase sigma-70 factor (ECF subfamily)
MAETPSRSGTRPSLLLRLRNADDTESWQLFVQTYAPLVYAYCQRQGLQDADAADVCQEVLAEVVRAMRTFEYRPERGRFRDWFGTVARHGLSRFRRRQARGPRGAGGDGALAGLDQAEAAAADTEWTAAFNTRVLQVAMERVRPEFQPTTWTVFERVWLEDRPPAEAAREAELPVEAVYAAKSRVLRRLREEVLLLAEDGAHLVHLT